jgi:xanthine dehydrogenase small subunit
LKGKHLSPETFDSAGQIALSEIAPISDVRGTMQYRNKLAANILRKLYYDLDKQQAEAATVS